MPETRSGNFHKLRDTTLISLANEQFIKNPKYSDYFRNCQKEITGFRDACRYARIPDFRESMPLRKILGWIIEVMKAWRPNVKYRPPDGGGEFELDFFGSSSTGLNEPSENEAVATLPQYIPDVKESLEKILTKTDLCLWLMIDKLDEIFLRRSPLETRALRGLLRTLRIFESSKIRVKVFLRDDILDQIVSGGEGFTALTHVTARQSDTLRWAEDQIMTMIVNRIYSSDIIADYLSIDIGRLAASYKYRESAFYYVFPEKVYSGSRQSVTLRWIYSHTRDSRGVVTPRDVIDLLIKAKQRQQDEIAAEPSGQSESIIGSAAIRYGLSELSRRKRDTFLKAEFPHLWGSIEKLVGGTTTYGESALRRLFGKEYRKIAEDLGSIGVLSTEKRYKDGSLSYSVPFLYRDGLELTQGRTD